MIQGPLAVSPDGRRLLLAQFPKGKGDLFVLDLSRPGEPAAITATPDFAESRASFSPDGRWLAFQSDESGRPEIYVQPFPGPGRKWQVSTAGGVLPIWGPRGGELFYRSADQQLTRVEVAAGASFDAGVPEPLFALPLGGGNSLRKIAITPDGERFLALVPAGDNTAAPVSVIVGWDAGAAEVAGAGSALGGADQPLEIRERVELGDRDRAGHGAEEASGFGRLGAERGEVPPHYGVSGTG